MSIRIPGIQEPFLCYDAHIDHPGEGGWGSLEQLEGLAQLDGGIRVFFCEPNGTFHRSPIFHLGDIDRIWEEMEPGMPPQWQAGRDVWWVVEGMESLSFPWDLLHFHKSFALRNIRGGIPIYHIGNFLGGCSKEDAGLTELGRSLMRVMMEHNLWVDLAHMSHQSMRDTLAIVGHYNVCYSHGGIWHDGVTDPLILNGNTQRMLTLADAEALAQNWSLVCLSPAQPFYDSLAPDSAFIAHIKRLGEVSAWRKVGIGTDYGGILDRWRLPGCRTIAECFATVIQALLAAGLEEWQVRRVVGLNVRDFFFTQR